MDYNKNMKRRCCRERLMEKGKMVVIVVLFAEIEVYSFAFFQVLYTTVILFFTQEKQLINEKTYTVVSMAPPETNISR